MVNSSDRFLQGISCKDRKKVIQECKNPIAGGNLKWIFACNCAGTEQSQGFFIWGQVTWLSI